VRPCSAGEASVEQCSDLGIAAKRIATSGLQRRPARDDLLARVCWCQANRFPVVNSRPAPTVFPSPDTWTIDNQRVVAQSGPSHVQHACEYPSCITGSWP